MAFRKSLAIAMIGSGLFCSIGACGSKESGDDAEDSAAQAGAPAPVMDAANNTNTAAAGASAIPNPSAATGGMSGQAGSGGKMSGSGGSTSMASGGAAAAGTGGAEAMDAAVAEEDDLLGLLGLPAPDAVSCEGLLCVETADCTSLYPDEAATCKFTSCVDFTCQ